MTAAGIPISWLVRHSSSAVGAGISFDALLSSSLIQPTYRDDRDRVLPAQYVLLWLNLSQAVQDAAHALTGSRMRSGSSALILRTMLGSGTLEGALHAVRKLYALLCPTLQLEVQTSQEHATLQVNGFGAGTPQDRMIEEVGLGWLFMASSYFLGRPLPVIEVLTRDTEHFNLGQHHWAIKAPVRLGQVAALRFSRSLLASPGGNGSSDSALWQCLQQWLQFVEADDMEREGNIQGSIDAHRLRLTTLAADAGVSPRTLRRRMQASAGSFRQVRQHQLVEAGVALLRSSQASVEDISAQLGYSDARSFRRFIKNATGSTPQDIRSAQSAPEGLSTPMLDIHRRLQHAAALLEQ